LLRAAYLENRDPGGRAYVLVSGMSGLRPSTKTSGSRDRSAAQGEFFGFASMLEQTPHQTNAIALDETICIEVDRHDIAVLPSAKRMRAWIC